MEILPVVLFSVLLTVAFFAPLRWSIVAYLILATVDFNSGDAGIGALNAIKGIGYPLVLLWRTRVYAGHVRVTIAPLAWMGLVAYAGIASFWSLFPLSAAKLVAEMAASLLICFVFLRATKAGALTPGAILVPTTIGVLAIGVIRTLLLPKWGGEPERFTGFTTAQGYAALLAALFALTLGAKTVSVPKRWILGVALFGAVVLDGSRIYVIGLIVSTLLALVISHSRAWLKILGATTIILVVVGAIAFKDDLLYFFARTAGLNRVADTVNAIYQGNMRSTGLGTYQFRRAIYQRSAKAIADSTLTELAFGHGTSNGRLLRGTIAHGVGDANRAVHNEWLRILYEWGGTGLALWFMFIGSIALYAYQGMRRDRLCFSRPLFLFLPAFLAGFSTENILAGAGHAENIGFILLVSLAAISHRERLVYLAKPQAVPRITAGVSSRSAGVRPYHGAARRQAV